MDLPKSLQNKLIKNFEDVSIEKIANAPVYALRGISEIDAKLLDKHFKIKTIKQLALFKHSKTASEIIEKGLKNASKTAEVLFKNKIAKSEYTKKGKDIGSLSISAILSIKKAESDFLIESFGIKTIRQLASFKYTETAVEILNSIKTKPKTTAKTSAKKPVKKQAVEKKAIENIIKESKELPEKKENEQQLKKISKKIGVPVAIIAAIAGLFLLKFTSGGQDIEEYIEVKSKEERLEKPAVIQEVETVKPNEVEEKPAAPIEPPPEPKEEAAAEYYTIQPQDTLGKISRKRYNNYNRWKDIYNANQEIIKNPALIYPGQKIILP
ncbi:MAG: LysM peptidoglycan-binding domain-containing protein [Spirochaetia bacterium]|nr:LysM peptidoglycan-binding domain-containing protein [Spirochaetia bacterium]